MKYLNNYKIFENKDDIDAICKKYHIFNYTINDDGSIDVNGSVNIESERLLELPLKFNRVCGGFNCSNNRLTSLEGSPKYVNNYFCHDNRITSLKGSPEYIDGCFYYQNNRITSLEGCPSYIGGPVLSYDNKINCLDRHFINRNNKNNLIELFNYCDIVQDRNVIYDRLEYFFSEIHVELTNEILKEIEENYKIIR